MKQQNGNASYKRTRTSLPEANVGLLPPHAQDMEKAILGVVLMGGTVAFETASEIFQGSNPFYNTTNAAIWELITGVFNAGQGIDTITVIEEAERANKSDEIGGAYEIVKLMDSVVSSANFENYCRIVQEMYLSRELITTCNEVSALAYQKEDVFDLMQRLEDSLFDLSVGKVSANYTSAGKVAFDAVIKLHELASNPEKLPGVPTGYRALDRVTAGWQNSDLIIIAARPSVGKTAFVLNLALNAARKGYGVGFFSLEMGKNQIIQRLMSAESLVHLDLIVRGDLTPTNLQRLEKSAEAISRLNIQVDDTAGLNIYQLRSKARKMVVKDKVQLIIIDYLQLMRGTNERRNENREQEISKISRELKLLAKSLNVPIIALSQMSRAVETRGGGKGPAKPQLSDLRESGAIEQDADVVGFLTRADYQKGDGEIDPAIAKAASLDIKKHRNGKLEEIIFETDLSTQRWLDASIIGDSQFQSMTDIDNPYTGFNKSSFQPQDQFFDNEDENAPF